MQFITMYFPVIYANNDTSPAFLVFSLILLAVLFIIFKYYDDKGDKDDK